MKIAELIGIAIVFPLFLIGIIGAEENPKNKSYKDHPMLSGPCFEVRGRMALYNGTPSVRIWPVGTKRILGISEGRFYLEGYDNVPKDLVRQLDWDTVRCLANTLLPMPDPRSSQQSAKPFVTSNRD